MVFSPNPFLKDAVPEFGFRSTGGKTRYEYMYSGLPLIADMAQSAFPFSEPIHIGEHAFWVRAIPCSAVAQQRHKIIRNGVALVGEESVSGSPAATAAGANRRTHDAHLHYRQ